MHASIQLPADLISPRAARHFAAVALRAWGHGHVTDVVTLLTSELITNAILHGGPEIELRLDDDGCGTLRVEVVDSSTTPLARRRAHTGAIGGRGLFLVEAMSRCCGVDLRGGGKAVWFEIDLTPAGDADTHLAAVSGGRVDLSRIGMASPRSDEGWAFHPSGRDGGGSHRGNGGGHSRTRSIDA